jgi:phage terminase large subunit-like protein
VADALDLLQALVLEDGRRWGDAAEPWQREDAEAILDQASPAPFHFLTRGRGGSKTGDLAGVALTAILTQAPPGSRLYAGAADRDQARLFADSIAGFQVRTPELRGALDVQTYRVAAPRRGGGPGDPGGGRSGCVGAQAVAAADRRGLPVAVDAERADVL